MAHISGEVTIDALVEEVFDLVADERTEPRYNPRIASAEKLSDGPVGEGTRFTAQPKGMGARGQMSIEISQYDRPRRLHNIVRSSYMHVDGTLTFTPVDGRTLLRWDWNMRLVGPMRVLSPGLALLGPRWERRNWVGLKRFVESGGR
ncbi:MAG: hypothetical protein BGO26_15405 [Actinobacteria bacterium 69-20]|nr:SRPBCC family protein [Actinomycetota bacterium]OJV28807.1 MAG: hypothetical protein BGO26_15405 [Actinobacteria bacterium 69-20]